MGVAGDEAGALELVAVEAAQVHVLAELADEGLHQRLIGGFKGRELAGDGLLHDRLHERLEIRALRDEIGLRVDLDDRARLPYDLEGHRAFLGRARGLLGRVGHSLFAQERQGFVEVALRLIQGALAVHHARAGLLAQVLDQ